MTGGRPRRGCGGDGLASVHERYRRARDTCWPSSVSPEVATRPPVRGRRTVTLALLPTPVRRTTWRPSTRTLTQPSAMSAGGVTRTVTPFAP